MRVYLNRGEGQVTIDRALKNAADNLYGDERLRSNLNDMEAAVIFDWALLRLTTLARTTRDDTTARLAVQADLPRVRAVIVALNDVARKRDALYSRQTATTLQSLVEPNRFITRPDLDRLLAALAEAAKRKP